jgi:hypothetical protein
MHDANMCIKQCALELVNMCILLSENFLIGNIFKWHGKGVQEFASLPNISFMIKLHSMCHLSSGSLR